MSILLNSAGASAADPILKGLALEFVNYITTADVAVLTNLWLDQNSTFPGTNSLLPSNISPAAAVITSGNNASITAPGVLTISSTTGLTAGDYIYLSGGTIVAGIYKLASIDSGTTATISGYSQGVQTGLLYQVAWRSLSQVAGTAPTVSSSGGTQNWFKSRQNDGASNVTDKSEDFYIRDAPAGVSYISFASKSYTGQSHNSTTPQFELLNGWTNKGGVSHLAWGAHSVQAATHFRWGDATTTEKTLAAVNNQNLSLVNANGMNYGALKLMGKSGGVQLSIDVDLLLDTSGPTVAMKVFGR